MGGIAGTQPIPADSGPQGTNFFDDPKLVKTTAASIITTILLAAFAMSLLPTLLLLRMNIDPAFIRSSVPTTIGNVAGFLLFLVLLDGPIFGPKQSHQR